VAKKYVEGEKLFPKNVKIKVVLLLLLILLLSKISNTSNCTVGGSNFCIPIGRYYNIIIILL